MQGFPRHGFTEGAKEGMCGLCIRKLEATYDNFAAYFAVRFVKGYSLEGRRAIDVIMLAGDETFPMKS